MEGEYSFWFMRHKILQGINYIKKFYLLPSTFSETWVILYDVVPDYFFWLVILSIQFHFDTGMMLWSSKLFNLYGWKGSTQVTVMWKIYETSFYKIYGISQLKRSIKLCVLYTLIRNIRRQPLCTAYVYFRLISILDVCFFRVKQEICENRRKQTQGPDETIQKFENIV